MGFILEQAAAERRAAQEAEEVVEVMPSAMEPLPPEEDRILTTE